MREYKYEYFHSFEDLMTGLNINGNIGWSVVIIFEQGDDKYKVIFEKIIE